MDAAKGNPSPTLAANSSPCDVISSSLRGVYCIFRIQPVNYSDIESASCHLCSLFIGMESEHISASIAIAV